jgi:hypothetical protein
MSGCFSEADELPSNKAQEGWTPADEFAAPLETVHNMSVPKTTAVHRMPTRETGHMRWFIVPPAFAPSQPRSFGILPVG